jgi:O-methyltransferase
VTIQQRYLALLRKALINELYLENDARMMYMALCTSLGRKIEVEVLSDITQRLPKVIESIAENRAVGKPWWNVPITTDDGVSNTYSFRNYVDYAHSMIGARRMQHLEGCLDTIRRENVPGDLAETGVWRGGAVVFMRAYLETYEMPDRIVWAADSFEGLPVPTHPADAGFDYSAARLPVLAVSLDEVKRVFSRYDLLDDRVRFIKGWFRDSLPAAPIEKLALLRLDGDLYESTWDALNALYDKVVAGGFVIIDDHGDFPPCRKAVEDFRRLRGITEPIEAIDWSGAYWRKTS